ncbi:MAG TPA: class I SAM-dependent methyltransferase [Solirubrobacteraceae bacterium]|nr:class I SAM-dependent methyltransferase [Solirubrobacteraceae bacterium]
MSAVGSPVSVIWHDLECGAYAEDLPLWRELAAEHGDPVLDVGAGTGRVTLDLARAGYRVTALDRDPELLEALANRALGRNLSIDAVSSQALVTTVVADARDFDLGERFPLIIVPMQTSQLFGAAGGRAAFLRCALRHLRPGGALAIAIAEALDLYDATDSLAFPLPDIREIDGIVYSSQPVAVRAERGGFVLERRRETVAVDGERTVERDLIRLDRVTARGLEREGRAAGFARIQRARVQETSDYVASEVVILRAPAQ